MLKFRLLWFRYLLAPHTSSVHQKKNAWRNISQRQWFGTVWIPKSMNFLESTFFSPQPLSEAELVFLASLWGVSSPRMFLFYVLLFCYFTQYEWGALNSLSHGGVAWQRRRRRLDRLARKTPVGCVTSSQPPTDSQPLRLCEGVHPR